MRGRTRNKGPNPLTRSFESNGPDVKIRGTAQHIADKYAQLARDAQASSDPVSAENYLQHAEHYYRLIAAAQEQFKQQYGAFQRSDEEGDDGDEDMQGPNGFGHPGERMNQDEFGDGGYGQPAYEGRPNGGERPMPPRYDRNDREYRNDRPNNDRPGHDRQDRGDQNRNDNYRGDNRGQRFDRGEQRFDRNAPSDRNASNGAGPERAPQAYDRNEGQRPDQPRNGVDPRPDASRPDTSRPDTSRPEGGRPDGNRRDRFNRDANRGDAPRQDGGRRDFNRPDRGPRQDQPRPDQPRQDQPRQDQPRHEQPRQDAPRYEPDEVEGAGLPAFLMNPVRPPVSAPVASVPDEAPRTAVVAQSASAPSGADEVPESPAEGEAVTGIRPRRRRTRKVADAASEAPAPAVDDTPVD